MRACPFCLLDFVSNSSFCLVLSTLDGLRPWLREMATPTPATSAGSGLARSPTLTVCRSRQMRRQLCPESRWSPSDDPDVSEMKA